MIPTFEEVHALTNTVSSPVLLQPWEAELLHKVCSEVTSGGIFVEIGSHYGRSSSLILQMAKAIGFNTIHIDPYADNDDYHGQEEILVGWKKLMNSIGHPYCLHRMKTKDAVELLPSQIDVGYIDGDHTGQGVLIDLRVVADRIKVGGFLLAHDYGKTPLTPNAPESEWGERFPDVSQVINDYVASGWEAFGLAETMGAWRKL